MTPLSPAPENVEPTPQAPNGLKSPIPYWLVLLIAAVPLLGWWAYGLFDLDEGFYAAVVAEMNRRGEWITPYYNGKPWYEKPILLYWLAKPSVALFGETFGPLLPSVLATIGLYALVGWFARRRFGALAAVLSVLILASSILMVALGQLMMTDAILTLALTGAFLTFWESLVGDRRWRLVTAACLGFAVLAKGPVGLAFFVLIAGYTLWRERPLRLQFRGYWLLGTLILAAVIATWYLPAYLKDGEFFVREFLIKQNVGRFTGGDQAHTVRGPLGWAFYVLVLLLGLLPWSLCLVWMWLSSLWQPPLPQQTERAVTRRYLGAWALIVFLFFTISGAKLPHYILPCVPPLVLLVGEWLARRLSEHRSNPARSIRRSLSWTMLWLLLVTVLIQGLGPYWYRASGHAEIHALARWVRAQGGEVAAYQMPRRQKALGTCKPKIQETSHPSLAFYLNRTVLQTDELQKLLEAPKPLWILTRWNRVTPEDVEIARRAGYQLEWVQTQVKQNLYALWRLTPA